MFRKSFTVRPRLAGSPCMLCASSIRLKICRKYLEHCFRQLNFNSLCRCCSYLRWTDTRRNPSPESCYFFGRRKCKIISRLFSDQNGADNELRRADASSSSPPLPCPLLPAIPDAHADSIDFNSPCAFRISRSARSGAYRIWQDTRVCYPDRTGYSAA